MTRTRKSSGQRAVAGLLGAVVLAGCAGGSRPMLCPRLPSAEYPPAAKAAGVEGFVTLTYDVATSGQITNIRVVASEPPGVFDKAAIVAVTKLECNAPVVKGKPRAAVNVPSTIRFHLAEGDEYAGY